MAIVMPDLNTAVWRKSSYSDAKGICVEVAALSQYGATGVRDSKDPTGPALMFRTSEWAAFTAGVRHGEFD